MGKGVADFIRDDLVTILTELRHIRQILENIEKNTRKP